MLSGPVLKWRPGWLRLERGLARFVRRTPTPARPSLHSPSDRSCMALRQQLHITQRQEMRMNPRLYQAMDLLYLPLLELEQHLKQELVQNRSWKCASRKRSSPSRPRPRSRRRKRRRWTGRRSSSTASIRATAPDPPANVLKRSSRRSASRRSTSGITCRRSSIRTTGTKTGTCASGRRSSETSTRTAI